ncbi:hypothetical protein HK097_000255 [Rhizophlyctis rosea]|uniref:DUF7918 domain-containing protein n=1 Tax=Rhizophlyctis rosea TaxID=64517 RepID=A0AAD5WYZ2_9FUNG|nr:hypothetical protein HK097_000255 [Rhizophlyctis rosea]
MIHISKRMRCVVRVDNEPLEEYMVQSRPNEITCWIAAAEGKHYTVEVTNDLRENTMDDTFVAYLYVDGNYMDNIHIRYKLPETMEGHRGDSHGQQIRPFKFDRLVTKAAASANPETMSDLSTIEIIVKRAKLKGRSEDYSPLRPYDSDLEAEKERQESGKHLPLIRGDSEFEDLVDQCLFKQAADSEVTSEEQYEEQSDGQFDDLFEERSDKSSDQRSEERSDEQTDEDSEEEFDEQSERYTERTVDTNSDEEFEDGPLETELPSGWKSPPEYEWGGGYDNESVCDAPRGGYEWGGGYDNEFSYDAPRGGYEWEGGYDNESFYDGPCGGKDKRVMEWLRQRAGKPGPLQAAYESAAESTVAAEWRSDDADMEDAEGSEEDADLFPNETDAASAPVDEAAVMGNEVIRDRVTKYGKAKESCITTYDATIKEEYVKFIFKYRSREVLEACGIIPLSTVPAAAEGEKPPEDEDPYARLSIPGIGIGIGMNIDQEGTQSKKRSVMDLGLLSSDEEEDSDEEDFRKMFDKTSKPQRKARRPLSPREQVWIDMEADGGPSETVVPVVKVKREVPVIEVGDDGLMVGGGLGLGMGGAVDDEEPGSRSSFML